MKPIHNVLNHINRIPYKLFAVLLIFALFTACKDSEYTALPDKIASFVTQYFPGYSVDSYSNTGSLYHVRLKNGPGLTFNHDQDWISINGYGLTLPQVLLFDQLPPDLYVYLEETENTENIFSVERDGFAYTLVLLNETIKYDIATSKITVDTAPEP